MLQISDEAPAILAEQEGKIAAVIKTLREAMRAMDAKLYVRPLLTSFSALGDVHGALRLIKEAKEEQLATEGRHSQGERCWLTCSSMSAAGLEAEVERLVKALAQRCTAWMQIAALVIPPAEASVPSVPEPLQVQSRCS